MRDTALVHDQEAIVAQCTPQGSGALALVRISGINAVTVAARISVLASGQSLLDLPTHTIHYGSVIEPDRSCIDNVLFFLMRGPKTFTGQDTVEITCHNNPFIIEKIIEVAIGSGARLAHNGEFSYRAVLNEKIDIVQAEGINELIHANTQMGLKQALSQVNGSFSQWINDLEKKLIKALAFCEASFEFIDEEMAFDTQIKEIISDVLASIETIKLTFDKQKHIRQGVRIAIIGSVNVGKSSLFNAFLHQKRAIVTSIPGTTRDVIEAGLYRDGNYWTLIDTAGLRETEDVIEQEGIERSFEQAELADIIMLVFDASRVLTAQEESVYKKIYEQYTSKIISVRTKIDVLSEHDIKRDNVNDSNYFDIYHGKNSFFTHACGVSSKTGEGMSRLEAAISHYIAELFASSNSPFLLNKRHFNILLSLEKELHHIQESCAATIQYELISYHLNDALAHLAELTGKSISEQGMDAVFREFCVGK
ncbi:MAG: tRNA uridine-5-carboxymethylaminomethyl(34) synthesis GTPase MnmE [Candidatus Dependentiae bacterium]|nr:tRNA uridine-5-carboxymethylaminomethyl(34) synthesis GTPase MnmE [Candidatus Dependentiae bacterium]